MGYAARVRMGPVGLANYAPLEVGQLDPCLMLTYQTCMHSGQPYPLSWAKQTCGSWQISVCCASACKWGLGFKVECACLMDKCVRLGASET